MASTARDGDTTVPGRGEPVTGPTRTAELPADDDDSLLRDIAGMSAARATVAVAAGEVIGEHYKVTRELGAGGMGVVYLARDRRLHRDVAVKLHVARAEDPQGARLFREATAMAQLAHPNVATVYEVGTWRGHPFVAMEYVAGGTLRGWLRAAPRTTDEIVARFVAAGRGLAAAHRAGIVHRDFKPDNVLCDDEGRTRVADFGLACESGVATSRPLLTSDPATLTPVTQTGSVMGTPAYMAPEQRDGHAVGPAADQYAFAVALWEALEGARPATPPVAQKLPRALERALVRALAIDPDARWPSIAALLDALTRPRRRVWPAATLAAVVLLGGGGAWLALRGHDAPTGIAGYWSGDFGRMVIRQDGDQVRAVYEHDSGTLTGRIVGGKLIGTWCELPTRAPPHDAGHFELQLGDASALDGYWQYAGVDGWADDWHSSRESGSPPDALLARFDDPTAFCDLP